MKFKYYLRGLGIGILFATIVLMISFYIHDKNVEMTDTDVILRAEELGMVFAEDVGNTESEGAQSIDSSGSAESDRTSQSQSDSEAEGTSGPEGQSESGASGDTGAETTNQSDVYVLSVEQGMIWRDIATVLAEEGIVDDADAFWDYVYQNARHKTVYVGEFEIPRDADYDAIIDIIVQ